jgi:hypothetical protein
MHVFDDVVTSARNVQVTELCKRISLETRTELSDTFFETMSERTKTLSASEAASVRQAASVLAQNVSLSILLWEFISLL